MVAKLAPLVVIVGETASGKSDLAMQLAKKFNGEIIAADSWTVRQEVNIGTSKPSKKDQLEIPHHLIDIVPACSDFTAALFKEKANRAIDDIAGRGKLPIMVGGTGLYIDSVIFDYSFLDDSDNNYNRDELNGKSLQELLDMAKAKKLPLEKIDTRNKRRVIRLIETNGDQPTKAEIRANTLVLGVQSTKEVLEQRIANRTKHMIEAGLKDEVAQLAEKYGWECEALKGIGYIEWKPFFEGNQTVAETEERINISTKKLAKRQRTWFKRNKSIHWVKSLPQNGAEQSEAVELVTTLLQKT